MFVLAWFICRQETSFRFFFKSFIVFTQVIVSGVANTPEQVTVLTFEANTYSNELSLFKICIVIFLRKIGPACKVCKDIIATIGGSIRGVHSSLSLFGRHSISRIQIEGKLNRVMRQIS